ncbi:MAG: hypothetical protein ACLTXI_01340 [Collinsella sp.]
MAWYSLRRITDRQPALLFEEIDSLAAAGAIPQDVAGDATPMPHRPSGRVFELRS